MYSVVARTFNLVAVKRQKVLNILCVSLWPQLPSMQCPGVKLPSVSCPALQSFPHYLTCGTTVGGKNINPSNAELNPICHLLALLGAHHIFHVSGLRIKHKVCFGFLYNLCLKHFPF